MPESTDLALLAEAVASHLGEDWKALAGEPDLGTCTLLRSDGIELRIRFVRWRDPARVSVVAILPGRGDQRPHGLTSPSITAATKRGAQAIGSDIQRRLLPEHELALAQVRQFQEKLLAAAAARQSLAERAAALLPGADVTTSPPSSRAHSHTVRWRPTGGPHLRLTMVDVPDTVDISLGEIPAQVAVQLCELVAQAATDKGPGRAQVHVADDFPASWKVMLCRSQDGTPIVEIENHYDPDDPDQDKDGVPYLRVYSKDREVHEHISPQARRWREGFPLDEQSRDGADE
jgi:hypothetical protein